MPEEIGPTAGFIVAQGIKTYDRHGFRGRDNTYLSKPGVPIDLAIEGFAEETQRNKGAPGCYLRSCIQSGGSVVKIGGLVVNLHANRNFAVAGIYRTALIIPFHCYVHSFRYRTERDQGAVVLNYRADIKV